MLRKNMYKWHRTASLIIAIPVLLWATSGFLHPIMTSIRPSVATQALPPRAIDSNHIQVSLRDALQQNNITAIRSMRMVHIDTNWFYQVRTVAQPELQYISTHNGKLLRKGDWLYAQYLAKNFLQGVPKDKATPAPVASDEAAGSHDCCDAATACVLTDTSGALVKDAVMIDAFDDEYKSINKLLPVYKVSFDRADGIRLYVETGQDRFALAVDDTRAAFTTFFSMVHTWGWLAFLGKGKLIIEVSLAGLAFLTALMGLYIFFTTKSKKVKGNTLVKARRRHRVTSVVASLFTLMFTFSGAYHAFEKIGEPAPAADPVIQNNFAATGIHFNLQQLQAVAQKPITNIGLVQIDGQAYWQVYCDKTGKPAAKDLMKAMSAAAVSTVYIRADNYSVLPEGEKVYANYLAAQFSHYDNKLIASTGILTKFNDEYNFADKRLPVWKVQYTEYGHQRFYIETSSGTLAKNITDADLYEGYSFALLHKHHFMDFAGKTWRDGSTMLGAFLQIAMVTVGLVLFFT